MATSKSKRTKFSLIGNGVFLEEAKELMTEKLDDALLFDVNEDLFHKSQETPISASLLTASEKRGSDHFFVTRIKDEMKKQLKDKYIRPLFEDAHDRMKHVNLQLIISKFKLDLVTNFATVAQYPVNEAEVRLTFGDPLVRLFTDFNPNFKVDLELPITSKKRKKGESSGRLSLPTKVSESVSEGSRSDYAVFMIENSYLACIMEAKYKWTLNAVAQATGYFVSSETNAVNPPVVCVLSKDTLDVIIFPFKADQDLAVNAVSIPFGTLEEPHFPGVVCLLVLMSHSQKRHLISDYSGEEKAVAKRNLRTVICRDELEEMEDRLNTAVKTIEKMTEELEEKKKKIQEMEEREQMAQVRGKAKKKH